MARPIRNTPVLYGKDATQFLRQISMPISAEELARERQRVKQGAQHLIELAEKLKSKKI